MAEHSSQDKPRGHRSGPSRSGGPNPRGQAKSNKPRRSQSPRKPAILDVANEPMPDLSDGPGIAIKDMKSMTMQQLTDLA